MNYSQYISHDPSYLFIFSKIFSFMTTPRIVKNLFIGGKFVKSVSGKTFDVINPADETVTATIDRGCN